MLKIIENYIETCMKKSMNHQQIFNKEQDKKLSYHRADEKGREHNKVDDS